MQYEESFVRPADFSGGSSEESSDAHTAWNIISSIMRQELDPQLYEAYFKQLEPRRVCHDKLEFVLAGPSKFVIEKIERTYGERLVKLVNDQFEGTDYKIIFEIDPLLNKVNEVKPVQRTVVKKLSAQPIVNSGRTEEHSSVKQVTEIASQPSPPLKSEANLNPKYTFSNFIVGNSNQFCHAAARQVAEGPGLTYNPLFIYGGVGLGKTHLLHAIGNAVLEKNPAAKVIYMSSESFTNELIQGLRTGKMDDFKKRLRECDVLLIDDIQFISGKERTQEEFFHTFNTLYSAKKQIIITSDTIPQGIEGLKERLQTRFSWGLIADLQAPDFETRVAILNRKAALDSFFLPMDVAHYISENISTNVRELEGALTRLSAVCSLQGVGVSMPLAESVLKPMIKSAPVNITVEDIKRVVSSHFGLKVSDLCSKKRSRSYSFPRHIAMYLCRKHTTCSYPDIGNQFGGRDHSSVIHAANVVGKKLKTEAEVRAIVDKVQEMLLA